MRKDRRGHWAKTIAEQEESGLSVPVFCRHWRRRLRTVDRPVRFSQVETKPARDCATALQIVFAGGERLCCSCCTTISSRCGKKMWNVPELTEQYVQRMEDVLETYER